MIKSYLDKKLRRISKSFNFISSKILNK